MAKKVALLIGVSEYGHDLNPLPAAVRDVQAMEKVLKHPEMGSFSEVKTLLNCARQEMEEAIETLFRDGTKNDLVLFHFSGHGIKDDSGQLYFATRITRLEQGKLARPTAVAASIIREFMSNSSSRRQVVILDCCFSGAFAEGMLVRDDGFVDVKNQLGGEGRAILTSSTSTQYSIEQKGSELSIYTRYLVEGIDTGAADLDNDGEISVDELHEYTKQKVHEAVPAMKPELYPVREGFKIVLAKAPIGEPKPRYRKTVERLAHRGEISDVGRRILSTLQETLNLPPNEAAAIEAEVLEPYLTRKQNLQEYREAFTEAIKCQNPISDVTRDELKHFQQILGLRDKDIEQIEEEAKQILGFKDKNTEQIKQVEVIQWSPVILLTGLSFVTSTRIIPLLCGVCGLVIGAVIATKFVLDTVAPVKLPNPSDDSLADVKVPKGVFNYSGSTSWAPLHAKIYIKIRDVWPQYELRYIPSDIPGSGTGIQMLLSQKIAFALSSRSITGEEQQVAKQRGFSFKEIPVAIDGIAIAVNPNLDIKGLTLTDLKNIYTGKITNWKQVENGPDLEITPYSRRIEEGGTVDFFSKKVLNDERFGFNVKYVHRTTEGFNVVAKNPGGIYYASAPEVIEQCRIKPLPIGKTRAELIAPYQKPLITTKQCLNQGKRNQLNIDIFETERYPITRQLFVIIKQNDHRDRQAGEAYAKLLLTTQGRNLIKKAGFVPIP